MRPLRLELEGLHSYKDPVAIDFDALTRDGLFAIVGPTGSGKSTLLDAITLALYGTVDRFTGHSVASTTEMTHSAATELTVAYEFLLGGVRYRAKRRFRRNKNSGLVSQRDAELVDLDRGEALASQASEVNAAVAELLGMDFAQFTRAVFLPQNKFAQFLDDTPAKRLELLEELFGLRRFGDALQGRLRHRRGTVKAEHDRLTGALESEGYAAITPDGLETLEGALAEAATKVARHEAERAKLEGAAAEAKRLREAAEALEAATARLEALDRARPQHEANKAELDAARRAAPVRAVLERRRTLASEVVEAQRELAARQGAHDEAREAIDTFLELKPARVEKARARRDELVPLVERLQAVASSLTRWERDEAALASAKAQLGRLEAAEREAPPAGVDADEVVLAALAEEVARGVQLEGELAERAEAVTQARASLARRREELAGHRARADELARELERAHAAVGSAEDALDKAEVRAGAGALVHALVDGEPCPVCGAAEHPAPADDGGVDLDGPRGKVRAARKTIEALVQEQGTVTGLVKAGQATLDEDERALEGLQARLDDGREKLSSLANRLPEGVVPDPSWGALHGDTRRWLAEVRHAAVRAQVEVAEERVSAARAAWAPLAERLAVPPDRPTKEDIAQHIEAVEADIAELDGVERALADEEQTLRTAAEEAAAALGPAKGRAETLARSARDAAAELDQALERAGLADEAAVEAAHRDETTVAALEAAVKRYTDQRTRAEAEHERVEALVEGSTLTPEEATETLAALARLDEALAHARDERARLDERVTAYKAKLDEKARLQERFAVVDAELGRLAQIDKLLQGKRFIEYLARARFEAVLAQASHRLARITGGKYHLRGDPSDIHVLDLAAGGAPRALPTLSGGERFMVALSLALALSDAIQHQRGGGFPPVEFFFLDEGFGTLDPDTLDGVMRMLRELAADGLHVGIITHVEAAHRYLPARLVVTPADGERGSRVRVEQ